MWSAVACAITGVIKIRLNRNVIWICALLPAGFTALQLPCAAAAYSPPGAFIGGELSTVAGGLGSVTYSHAALAGGVALVTGPCGHGSVTCAPMSWRRTVVRTSAFVGSGGWAWTAARAPSRAAWLRAS